MPNVTGFFVGGGRGRRGPPTLYFFAPPLSTMRDGRIAASRVFIKGRHARNAVDELALLLRAIASPAAIGTQPRNRSSDGAALGVEKRRGR